ncbi:MAG: hypothetical protein E5V22_24660 [Mesorhizobium sp.]|uniref:hypothetical protein n=1 Tax=Mesorhizobium sp. TaxID=1871066 RepID=UPI000FE46C9D|nr:hypothetical protein [Mesorhizobium sp.]RWE53857.1 MAG: hypothetical protein EOS24_26055 [Mesorhizobium sp.]TIY00304.1 MAG: hypothetical protein E5V22_24660 [Mesorhizobium sp.]
MSAPADNLVPFRKQSFTGKRRQIESRPALALGWPTTTKARYEVFDAWHKIAMREARTNGVGRDFLAVARIVMRWNRGEIIDTSAELAERAGGCHPETIKREIAQHARLGTIIIHGSAKRRSDGGMIRTRTIRLSIPADLDPSNGIDGIEYDEGDLT